MANVRKDIETRSSAVAIAQDENKLKAVELVRRGETFEVMWTRSREVSDGNWSAFAAECGLSMEPEQAESDKMTVAGFGLSGIGFYRISMPAAGEEEISAMVKLQAEALLPLSAEQMEFAWRVGRVRNGEVAVTMAAARKERLQKFVDNVRVFQPAKILLSCEAIVKMWRMFFGGDDNTSVIINLAGWNTQVCLVEDGRLSNAVVLDTAIEDLLASEVVTEQTETSERFAQDIRSVLELFGYAGLVELPIFVLSDGSSEIESIVSCLNSADLKVKAALPNTTKLKTKTGLSVEEIYEYRVPIGLGLCALDDGLKELNIFEHLYTPARAEGKKHWLYSPKIAGVITALMFIVLIMVSYIVDVASPKAIEKRMQTSDSSVDIKLLEERQKLMKIVAQQRPDLLEVLNQLSAGDEKGIMLDSFHFKKGQPINITGQAQNSDQLYKFQESLLGQKNIKEVRIQSASKDDKGGKIKFTITFHYKNFTRKGRL